MLDSFYQTLGPTWWLWSVLFHAAIAYLAASLLYALLRDQSLMLQGQSPSQIMTQLVQALEPRVDRWRLPRYRVFLDAQIRAAGLERNLRTNQLLTKQVVYGGAAVIGSYLFFCVVLSTTLWIPVMMGLAFFALPLSKVQGVAGRRQRSFHTDLAYFIDYLSLCMDAGLEFNQAVHSVTEDAPAGALREEFAQMLRTMQLGLSREEAIDKLRLRVNTPAMTMFSQTMIEAIKIGSDIAQTLRIMADTIHNQRFNAAEEMAGKISVRMMIPLMVFVLPSTVIMLLGPMLLEWIQKI